MFYTELSGWVDEKKLFSPIDPRALELRGDFMATPRISFTYGNRDYTVNQRALDTGKILLPDGTLLSIVQRRLTSSLSICQKNLQPEKISQLLNGMIPAQLAPLVGAVLAEERME